MKKLLVLFAVCVPLYAQSISMPEMPSMLEMPSVSMPSTDGTFYTPTVPSFYNGSTNTAKKQSSTNTSSSDSASSESQTTAASSSSSTAASSAASTNLNLITSLLYGDDYLTASDLNSLSSSGSLSSLTSLTGLSALSTSTTSASSNVLLSEILTSINELKEGQKKLETSGVQATATKDVSSVLRFRVNGYDLLSGLSEVYFSTPETDGSFLLTADRTYQADRRTRKETLYLLFRYAGNSGTARTYQVEASVMQDSENQNSLVYKLCSGGTLSAVKTGNLVVLNGNQNGVACDILLDIGK